MNKDTGIGFDALFSNASLGIVVADEQGSIILVNPFLLEQFGYAEKELLGQQIEKLIPERHHKRHVEHVYSYNQHPQKRPMGLGLDLYGIRKDKTEFPVEVSLGNYQTDQGKYVIAFLSDISKRKVAENALQQLNEELEQKVEDRTITLKNTVKQLAALIAETEVKDAELNRINIFLKNIWDHAEALILVTDKEGIIKMMNPAAERLLKYNEAELVNKKTPSVFLDKDHLPFSSFIEKIYAGQPIEREIYYTTKDGIRFPVSQTFTSMRNTTGEIEGYLIISMDISRRKKAENDMIIALNKEKDLSELKSRFVSIASHEFRTPLSTVLSSAYLVSQYAGKEDQPRREKHIQRIISSVDMLTDILNDFLSVGKIEEGKIQIRRSLFDIKQHIQQIVSELSGLLKKNQQIKYTHKGKEKPELDPSLMRQILTNLLSNAIKFSPEGGIINIESELTSKELKISVADQGIGISEEDQQHLFERFFRGANATTVQGTGLGLHIVSRYAELLNGNITCRSQINAGTTFNLHFQLTQ